MPIAYLRRMFRATRSRDDRGMTIYMFLIQQVAWFRSRRHRLAAAA